MHNISIRFDRGGNLLLRTKRWMSDTTWTEDHYPKWVVGLLGGFGGLLKNPKCSHVVYEALAPVVLEMHFERMVVLSLAVPSRDGNMSSQDQVIWAADRMGELQVMRPPVVEFQWTEKGFLSASLNKIDKLHALLGAIDGKDADAVKALVPIVMHEDPEYLHSGIRLADKLAFLVSRAAAPNTLCVAPDRARLEEVAGPKRKRPNLHTNRSLELGHGRPGRGHTGRDTDIWSLS